MVQNRYRIDAVWTATEVLREVAEAAEPLGTKEISAKLGISENTSYRMCETLSEAGLLTRIGSHYELGTFCMLIWAKSKVKLETRRELINKLLDAAG